jgi:hypothetical protein
MRWKTGHSLCHAIRRQNRSTSENISQFNGKRRKETTSGIANHANSQIPSRNDRFRSRVQNSVVKGGGSVVPTFLSRIKRARFGTKETVHPPCSFEFHCKTPKRDGVESRTHDGATTSHHGSQEITNDTANMKQRHHIHWQMI